MHAVPDILIGIDIGTTNLKAVAIRPGGRVQAVARRAMHVGHPGHGWSEFDLDTLDRDLVAVLREVAERLASAGPHRVCAIGVTSIGESFVGLDAAGRRLTPCPTWYDRRTTNTRESLGLSAEAWFDITGMVDDDIYTVHRLAWWKNAAPDWFGRVATWLMVADYAVMLLCGQRVAAPSLAARSGLADRRSGTWSQDILLTAGIAESMLPALQPAASLAGTLTPDIAAAAGLPEGVAVVHAGHDHPCAGFGCGLANPGRVIDSTGTSEALKTVVARPLRYGEVRDGAYDCYPHAVPGRFLLSGHIPSSGALIDWLVRLLSGPRPDQEAGSLLWQAAAEALPGAGGVRLAPFLNGTGAPWNERGRRGEIASLDQETSAGALLRGGVEALAAWLKLNADLFESISGQRVDEFTVTGGGARNALANAIKAAVLDRPLARPEVDEAAGVGAALVAGLAVGQFASADEAARLPDVTATRIEPDPALVAAYRQLDPPLASRFPVLLRHADRERSTGEHIGEFASATAQ